MAKKTMGTKGINNNKIVIRHINYDENGKPTSQTRIELNKEHFKEFAQEGLISLPKLPQIENVDVQSQNTVQKIETKHSIDREKRKFNVITKSGREHTGVIPTTIEIDGVIKTTHYSLKSAVKQLEFLEREFGEKITYNKAASAFNNNKGRIETINGIIVRLLPASDEEIETASEYFTIKK